MEQRDGGAIRSLPFVTERFTADEVPGIDGFTTHARLITAVRAADSQTLGDDVPFLERSILGGKNTLRGHGDNRFIDSSYVLLNIEERIRLFRSRVFNVNMDWEIAPFIDLGARGEGPPPGDDEVLRRQSWCGIAGRRPPERRGPGGRGLRQGGPRDLCTLGYPF